MKKLLERPRLRLEGEVAAEVARRDALLGSEVAVEGGPRGTARGIDAGGRLRIEVTPGAVTQVHAGSVMVTRTRPVVTRPS
jgi:biotin-(acetyl-CoA carboxylase) ligase